MLVNIPAICVWLRTHYVWVMNIFFKNLLDDYYSACSYVQFPYFKFNLEIFFYFFINTAPTAASGTVAAAAAAAGTVAGTVAAAAASTTGSSLGALPPHETS
jgi:hypothetical protein